MIAEETKIVRSSKVSLTKFANIGKVQTLNAIVGEYSRIVQLFINDLWLLKDTQATLPTKLPKEMTDKVRQESQTWLSARMMQCAGKQASGIVRGTLEKQKRRLYMIKKLKSEGKFKRARKLEKIYEAAKVSCPGVKQDLPMELDSRFVSIDFCPQTATEFDGWITLSSIGTKIKLELPFRQTVHLRELMCDKNGKLKHGARISNKNATLMFELPHIARTSVAATAITVAGVDIGVNSCISVTYADGATYQTPADGDIHGWTLDKINDKLSRKRKGSNAFARAQTHRTNFINWTTNQINWSLLSEIRMENIRGLRTHKHVPRKLSHFNYREIFDRLEMKAEAADVLAIQVSPTYTSQRCSRCGWTCKSNRRGKQFKCTACGYTADADLNASANIGLDLMPIGKKERQRRLNLKGFYWPMLVKATDEQAPIVPAVQKS